VYVVVLAGGGGTRLWPLSRPERPKPFLPLLGDETLLQRTVARLLDGPELGLTPADVTVVTDRRYAMLVRDQLADVRVLPEPLGRNTAAAIALATVAIERPEDEVMAVLPADHSIRDEAAFRQTLAAADALARGALGVEDALVTLGVRPTRPATEYGYVVPKVDEATTVAGVRAFPVERFEEKPKGSRVTELYTTYGVAWNAGMFLWRRAAIRAAIERYTGLLTLLGPNPAGPGLEAAYERVTPTSIDVAVMEGAASDGRVVMATLDAGWSDIGGWTALLEELAGADAGVGRVVAPGEELEPGAEDLVVRSADGRLALEHGGRGTMVSDLPMAHLAGAAAHFPAVQALLERVDAQERRA